MDVGKKESWFYLTRDTKGWGHWGMTKTFFIFLSPEAAGLVVPRESKNFVSRGQLSWGRVKNFCPEGVRKHPRRTKNFHSPEGQLAEGNKICTLPRDNKACGLKRKENEKSFCHPSVPPSFGYLLSNKINFFSYDHTIFLDGCVELAVRFCTKKDGWYICGKGPPLAVVAGVRLLLGHNAAGKHEKEKQGFWRLPREHLIESFKMSLLLIFWVDTWTCTSSPDPEAGRNMDLRCQPSHIKWGLISKLSMMLFSLHHPKPLWFFPAVLYGVFDDGFQVAREGNDWGCRLGVDIDHVLTGLLVFDCDFLVGLGVTEGGQVGDDFH